MSKRKGYIYEIGDIIDRTNNNKILILEKTWCKNGTNRQKAYIYKCLTCKEEREISQRSLIKGCGCKSCSLRKFRKPYKYNTGEKINNGKFEFIIKDRYLKTHKNGTNVKYYDCECVVCNRINVYSESRIKTNGCAICGNKVIVKNVNTMNVTHPELMKYLVNKEDGENYQKSSSKKVKVKCIDCGKEKKTKITLNKLYERNGISCDFCSDGVSYPEKVMSNLLYEINVEFEKEKSFEWAANKRYDFYIPELNTIIETHGVQHYEDKSFSNLKKCEKNDTLKKELAIGNGILNYIVVDCRVSDIDWISEEILKSKISELFNISKVDWKAVGERAGNSLFIASNDMFSRGESIKEISDKLHLNYATVLRYVKKGKILGLNNYEKELKERIVMAKNVETNKTKIFPSMNKCSLETGVNTYQIKKSIKENKMVCDKYIFEELAD